MAKVFGTEPRARAGRVPPVFAAVLLVCGLTGCDHGAVAQATPAEPEKPEVVPMSSLKLTSPAFPPLGPIPAKYTCEGANVSPPLAWSGAPAGTKSFALILDDPDAPDPAAPKRTWVHWVLTDIPPTVATLEENASTSGLPPGTHAGKNDFGKVGYGGPCPPIGRHRYFHKLYALDKVLSLDAPTKADLEKAMQGHILGKAEIIGTYQKGG